MALPEKQQVYQTIEGTITHFELVMSNRGFEAPSEEIYAAVEAPNGELGFFAVSDGTGHPYRLKVRPPCFPIFSSFASLTEGGMIPDAVAILGSLNIIAGELDR